MTASSVLNRTGIERVHYFPRQLMTADDMRAEQEYFRQKLRRHNRFLHGWGVVCGLKVAAAPTKKAPWQVSVSSGYALGPYGDEINVTETTCVDLAKCGLETVSNPCEPGQTTALAPEIKTLFVVVKYTECETRPVRVHPVGCACDDAACEYSRIRDDFEIGCLTEFPASHRPGQSSRLCDLLSLKQLPACPPCPEDPWVVLAAVTLPASAATNVNDNQIDNFVRRLIVSTALIQEQLIACCCTPPGSTPTGIGTDVIDRLKEHLDVQSVTHVMYERSTPEMILGLRAKNLLGVKAGSTLGKKVKDMTIGQVAGMSRDAFVERSLQGVSDRQRTSTRQQAQTVWDHADQVYRLTSTQ